MRSACAAIAALSVALMTSSPGRAASGRAMTIEDLITAVRVSDPQLSPDGASVLFVRTTTDGKSGKRNADIWMVPADGSGTPKALIGGDASDSTPRYSPDGKRIAFISSRDGSPQVYVADANGGGGKKVTNLSMGAQPPLVFSGDGNHVAFVSDVYPDCADEACNKQKSEEADKNPVKMHRLTRLLYPPLGRVAREHPPSRLRCGRRGRQDRRRDARRLRFASGAAGGRGDRVLSRRRRDRVRVEPRGSRQGGVDDEPRRVGGAGVRRTGEEDHVEPRVRPAAALFTRWPDALRARAAPTRVRVRSLVPRRLRSRHGGEAHGVHRARHLGRGLLAVA